MSGDVFDEVRSLSAQQVQPEPDDPFASVRSMKPESNSAKTSEAAEPESTWTNAIKGVGQAGLAIGAGALRGISSAANDILPGEEGRKQLAGEIEKDPILNYPGGPEAQPILNALRIITTPIAKIGGAIHHGIADVAGERTADVLSDLVTLAPALRGVSDFWKPSKDIEAGHPLTEAAESEGERLGAIKDRGETLGLDLPEGGTQARHAAAAITNRPIVNSVIRDELALPENAPLTPQMLQAARDTYTAPAYQAVRDVSEIKLPKDYLGDIEDFDSIKPKYRPPTGGTISGDRAVDLSRYLRERANKLFASAKANGGNVQAEDVAQAHWDAAQALEDAVKGHLEATGKGQLASNWDAARTYAAKTYSVQSALDGAGNVKVPVLMRQLIKGKPLSGDIEALATLGNEYPEAFKTTRITMPAPGIIRRGAAAVAPIAGAGLGGWLGGGYGATGGAYAGQKVGEKILGQ